MYLSFENGQSARSTWNLLYMDKFVTNWQVSTFANMALIWSDKHQINEAFFVLVTFNSQLNLSRLI